MVLDASVTLAWLFDDERSAHAETVLARVVASGAFVPSLWRLEVANVLRNASRRKRCDEAFIERSLNRLGTFAISVDQETDRHAWEATYSLACEQDLTLYDAAYLELALRRNLPIASFDTALRDAAGRKGVQVL